MTEKKTDHSRFVEKHLPSSCPDLGIERKKSVEEKGLEVVLFWRTVL